MYTDNIRQVIHVDIYILVNFWFLAFLVKLNNTFIFIASQIITYTLFDIIRMKNNIV